MNLQKKVNILVAIALTLFAGSFIAIGIWFINSNITAWNQKVLQLKMDGIVREVEKSYQVLEKSGLLEWSNYVESSQTKLIQSLKQNQLNEPYSITIIFIPDQKELPHLIETDISSQTIQTMVQNKNGFISFNHNNNMVITYYRVFNPLNWLLILSIPNQTVYHERTLFIKWSLLITVSFFILVLVLIITLLKRMVITPLLLMHQQAIMMAQGKIDLSPIQIKNKDEMADLAKAFNEMTNSLSLKITMIKQIASGDLRQLPKPESQNDHLGLAIQDLHCKLANIIDQAKQVAKGDYSGEIHSRSDNDEMIQTINEMKMALRNMNSENQNQVWLEAIQNELNQKMRGDYSIPQVSQIIMHFIASHLNIQVGAFYVEDNQLFHLQSTYGIHFRKQYRNTFKVGEGLVGQAVLEKEMIIYTHLPHDYVYVTTGLGQSPISYLIIIPFLYNQDVTSAIELGSFQALSDLELTLLSKIANTIAITIQTIKSRHQLHTLLKETQQQTRKLSKQQQALEIQAEIMRESESQLQVQQEELRATNEELEQKNAFLEKQTKEVEAKNITILQAKEAVAEKASQLKMISQYKSEFMSNMSHELRTPLNSMLILSQSLLKNKNGNLSNEELEPLSIIHQSGKDLLNMVNSILNLSKLETGKILIQSKAVDLKDLGELILNTFEQKALSKKLKISIIYDNTTIKTIQSDPQKIFEMLSHIISNAIKFTQKGSITIRFYQPDQTVSLKRQLSHDQIIAISVSDTGIGIPEDKQSEIFEAFKQANGTTTRVYDGTGLGLSISREIALMLGGEIHLQSIVSKGSTFTLYLPVKNAIKKESAPIPNVRPELSNFQNDQSNETIHMQMNTPMQIAPLVIKQDDAPPETNHIKRATINSTQFLQGKTVLLVNNDMRDLFALSKRMKEKGIDIIKAEKCERAIQLLNDNPMIHIVIIKMNMPGMDGYTCLKTIRNNKKWVSLPVIAILDKEDQNVKTCMACGANDYLIKPIPMDRLFSLMQVWMTSK